MIMSGHTDASWLQKNLIHNLQDKNRPDRVSGHDPDAEPSGFSTMFLLGLLWCCDCEVTLGSLRGGVHKIVNQITPASQSDPSIHEKI